MNFFNIQNREQKFLLPLILTLTILLITSCCYILIKLGVQCHWDEWTGRGLFPALAMAHGEDLYSLDRAPLVTSYGPGVALFYLPASLAKNPIASISIAYSMNILSMISVFCLCTYYLLKHSGKRKDIIYILSPTFLLLFIAISSIEKTMNYIYTIHADWPAMFFLITALIIFRVRLLKNQFRINLIIAILLSLSFWTKITVFPAIIGFILLPLLARRYKDFLVNIIYTSVSLFLIFVILGFAYGFKDIIFFTFKSAGAFPWIDRNSGLFEGNGMPIADFGNKLILLVKIGSLYGIEYWYYLFAATSTAAYFFVRKSYHDLLLPLTFILLLPGCLAALAKWGGIENSLLFCNTIGFLLIIELLFKIGSIEILKKQSYIYVFITLTIIALLLVTPIRTARAIPENIEHSPNNQAYQYLKNGYSDIYFAWYPISHYFVEKEVYSGLEVPTWVGLAFPNKIKFDVSHFPIDAEFIALCNKTTYGRSAIERSIGKLIKIEDRKNLANWSLYKIDEN